MQLCREAGGGKRVLARMLGRITEVLGITRL